MDNLFENKTNEEIKEFFCSIPGMGENWCNTR